MKQTTVFIVAAPRTGSTMLDMALGAHSQCVSVGELVYWESRSCSLCGDDCEYWRRFREIVKPPRIHEAAHQVFDSPFLIDSSKKVKWLQSSIRHVDHYKIIRLVRNGYDRLLTLREKKGAVSKEGILKWVRREERINTALKGLEHITVRYEDVCDGTALQDCCEFIGIEFEPLMREYWKIPHHGLSGSEKAYSLIRAYQGLPITDTQKKFIDTHGFTFTSRKEIRFMNADEETLWKRYGQKMNQQLGYC